MGREIKLLALLVGIAIVSATALWMLPIFSNPIDLIALAISILALVYAYSRVKSAWETLSFNAFMKALDVLGTKEAIDARSYIRQKKNIFPDVSSVDHSSKKGEEVKLWVNDGNSIVEKKIKVKKLIGKSKDMAFSEARRADRIGFMFYVLGIPKKLKKAYLEWLCIMFCEVWNRLAPYIILERRFRQANYSDISKPNTGAETPSPIFFTPYFEKLVYEAYNYYKDKKKNAKIVCLNPKCDIE